MCYFIEYIFTSAVFYFFIFSNDTIQSRTHWCLKHVLNLITYQKLLSKILKCINVLMSLYNIEVFGCCYSQFSNFGRIPLTCG